MIKPVVIPAAFPTENPRNGTTGINSQITIEIPKIMYPIIFIILTYVQNITLKTDLHFTPLGV